jgi:hypothetical protein
MGKLLEHAGVVLTPNVLPQCVQAEFPQCSGYTAYQLAFVYWA